PFFNLLADILNSYPLEYKNALEKYIAAATAELNPAALVVTNGIITPAEASCLVDCGKGITATNIWKAIRGLHGFNAFYITVSRDNPSILAKDRFDYNEQSL